MKRFLLSLAAASLLCGIAIAQEEPGMVLSEYRIVKLSPNGTWAVNEHSYLGYSILNLETLEDSEWYLYGENNECYDAGLGNSISNNGITVASYDYYDPVAMYYENGVWTELPLPSGCPTGTRYTAHGITPDGTRICGWIDLGTQTAPCIWTRQENGTYNPIILPYPKKDFTGELAQYICAVCISADGKMVFGQMIDNGGFVRVPVVFSEDAEGNWTYTCLGAKELFHEGEIEMPEIPEGLVQPMAPNYADYMTEEEYTAYMQAFTDYQNGLTDVAPAWADYASPEAVDKYFADLAKFEEEDAAYNEYYIPWLESYYAYVLSTPDYMANRICASPNGRYYATTEIIAVEDEKTFEIYETYRTVVFDTTTGEHTFVPSERNIYITQIKDDGSILGTSPAGGYESCAYIHIPGTDGFMRLEEYYATKCPALATWIADNLTFDVPTYVEDPDTHEWVTEYVEKVITGSPCANEDFSRIAAWVVNPTDLTNELILSFVYDENIANGVEGVAADTTEGSATYYNLQGMRVDKPENGIFIVVRGDKANKEFIK